MHTGIAIVLLECTLVLYEFVGLLVLLMIKHRSLDDACNYMNLYYIGNKIRMAEII